jgi:5-oxopent-3-ene-1,2,5-tricarboxylate decarboxylase/2-hydroxyhepta-2,4-diene-1,7-dioate isomerase
VKRARVIANGRFEEVVIEDGLAVTAGGQRFAEDQVTWLPPVEPGTILALALNYAEHASELELERPEQPALFPKLRNALIGHRGVIVRPRGVQFMHYENELAVVIGRPARRVKASRAMEVVKGYTIFNDLVVRDFVINHFRPPIKPKNFDTFGPMGPWLVDRDDIPDPQSLAIRTYVNGEERQCGNTGDMVYKIPEIIEYISEFMTLQPNDVILTGTPKGISHLRPGDTVRCQIEGIGALENRVVAEEDWAKANAAGPAQATANRTEADRPAEPAPGAGR